jgi:hypothetical protein
MKWLAAGALVVVFAVIGLSVVMTQQPWRNWAMMGGMGMGPGRCPMCGRPWDGTEQGYNIVPSELPKPQNQQWLDRLDEVLARERLSKAQYTQDSQTYQAPMPYRMIIPQEQNHIAWISAMFAAYGQEAQTQTPETKPTESLEQALTVARTLESDLIPGYEWLIRNAEDRSSGEILGQILMQTRMHEMMFSHALSMMEMMGRGRMGPMPERMR